MENDQKPFIEEWWTKAQIELVKDHTRIWEKKRFKAIPGYWIQKEGYRQLAKLEDHEELPPNAILDPTAWDHEHCSLCMQKISETESNQQEGYTDGKTWLCTACYTKYLAPYR